MHDFENITKKEPDFLCRRASNYLDISSVHAAVPNDLLSFHKLSEFHSIQYQQATTMNKLGEKFDKLIKIVEV